MKPSSAAVLDLLRRHPEGITPFDALAEARCMRLAARVSDLRADGYTIDSELVTTNGKRYARYTLVPDPVQVTLFFADAV
jgi:hypothetical protein